MERSPVSRYAAATSTSPRRVRPPAEVPRRPGAGQPALRLQRGCPLPRRRHGPRTEESVNVFQPSFKLAEKTRDGTRVRIPAAMVMVLGVVTG